MLFRSDFTGNLQPFNYPISANIMTDETFRVWGSDAAKLTILAQDYAINGSPYHVKFGLRNVSDMSIYNPYVQIEPGTNYNLAPGQEQIGRASCRERV